MQTSDIYHTQGIRSFKLKSTHYGDGKCVLNIAAKEHRCPLCASGKVSVYPEREREIQGQSCGTKRVYFKVWVHRIYCHKCRRQSYEQLNFLPYSKARVTRSLAQTLIELRRYMPLNAISEQYHVDYDALKALEMNYLQKKYSRICLKDVRVIGVDEIHVGHEWVDGKHRQKYLTIVRDLNSGKVLFVGDGKGCDALLPFNRKMRQFRGNIKAVCMDMSNAYAKWTREQFPLAEVVYDHFHVIKLVNDAIDDIRRSVQNDLDKDNAKYLKGKRYLPLRNQEDLNDAEKTELAELLVVSEKLHAAWRIKELLRGIYELADDPDEARDMLTAWADICLSSASPELEKLGRTVQRHLDGICAYWSCGRISNAAMEGFNNKVRHMIAQAYGFHDYEYMKLKIYELPSMVLRKQLLSSCA